MGRIINSCWAAGCALLACAAAAAQASSPQEFAPEQIRIGAELYERYCANCHGARMEGVAIEYDLRKFGPAERPRFYGAIVNGIKTMPPWTGLLMPQQIEALWAYTMSRKAAASAATAAGSANPPAPPPAQVWPCGGDSKLLVDDAGIPVWIGSEELKRHGISMPPLTLPSSVRAAGKLTVDVMVDSQGRVKCSRVAEGHPLLNSALTEAVTKWIFRPFSAGGQPVAVYGHLDFVFDNSR